MPGVLQRAAKGVDLGFIRPAWFLHHNHAKDAGSVSLYLLHFWIIWYKGIFVCITCITIILKPSYVPTYVCNLQFVPTASCISPSVVLFQLLAIGLCQWHHQCRQDLGRQSLKCWYRSCQHRMNTCGCLLKGVPSFFATPGVWTFIQGWCCTILWVTKAVTGAIKASKLKEDQQHVVGANVQGR